MLRRICLTFLAVTLIEPTLAVAADDEKEQDEQLLREAGLTWDGPALLEYFRKRALSNEQRQELLALIQKSGDHTYRERQRASARLETYGVSAIGLLKQAQRDPDPEIGRRASRCLEKLETVPNNLLTAAAARMIARVKPPGGMEALLAHLPLADDDMAADAMRGALAQLALRDGQAHAALIEALDDSLAVRRGAAGEALVRAGVLAQVPQVRKLLNDSDIGVRLHVAVALVTVAKERDAIRTLVDVLADLPNNLGWQAEEILYRLAGDDGPKVSLVGDAEARRRCREAWRDWWARHGATVDLRQLGESPQLLGYTLLIQMNANGTGGRVVELAPDGKTIRWQIDGLLMPVDAQVLPNRQRVLLAEHNAHMVTERDFQGRIHWRYPVSEPIACQRLPNGNTFIATRGQLLEVDAKGNTVFSHARPAHDIVAARRARDGQIVFGTNQRRLIRIDAKGAEVRAYTVMTLSYFCGMQLLPNNHVLVTHANSVSEYDEVTGKQIWHATVGRGPTSVFRLPNGNTLVACQAARKTQEVDRSGTVVSEQTYPDAAPWSIQRR